LGRLFTGADAVFYIQKGKVKVTVVSEQGKQAVVAIPTQCIVTPATVLFHPD
jgi:hypothetical protein